MRKALAVIDPMKQNPLSPYMSFIRLSSSVVVASLLASVPYAPADGHGGGLNAQGCHNDRRNGGYHCHRGSSAPAPISKPTQVYSLPEGRLYASCAAARAAGAAPLYRGDEGYGVHLDRDQDGVACEADGGSGPVGHPAPRVSSTMPAVIPLITAPVVPSLPIPIEGNAQVLDGDTIQIGVTRIRLFGIDAFEAEQMCKSSDGETYGCGGRATRALGEKISGEPIVCVPKGRDAFDRQLAVCRTGSTDLASWMARNGHALAFTRYAYDYVSDEAHAKADRAGAWGGSFEMPWDFRQTRSTGAAEAQRASTAPSANCVIKGNVTRDGERIYHMPTDPYYVRTKAENWFCGASEAERAGFRRAANR